ncbi:uncharacterized protein [Polyergus mexicanus]|uniref:uncharacterized protein n=1 Tax=Polyergus mexicanus TaxID=615972 RepID=UPI0038B62162
MSDSAVLPRRRDTLPYVRDSPLIFEVSVSYMTRYPLSGDIWHGSYGALLPARETFAILSRFAFFESNRRPPLSGFHQNSLRFSSHTRFENSSDHKGEPPCKICSRLTSPYAINSRTLKNLYNLPVRRRRECCETSRSNAKVGTDLRSEFDSRSYNLDPVVNKIQESWRNAENLDCPKREKRKIPQEDGPEPLADAGIIDLKNIRDTIDNCLWEMGKIKRFLENENSWWKLLKARPTDCCQQKLPHLHGVLDGSSVTLILLEEGTEQLPRHFVMVKSQKRSDVTGSNFRTSSRELERPIDPWKEHTVGYSDTYTVPHYNLDIRSTLIKVASTDGHEPTQRYAKRAVTSKQNIVDSEFWTETRESRSNGEKIPDRSPRFKETHDKMQFQDRKKDTDRSNIVPPREIWYGQNTQTMFDDRLKPRETFSSENTGKGKAVTADFESNVNLSREVSSRNIADHKSRTKTIIEKGFNHIQKFPTKISKAKSRD